MTLRRLLVDGPAAIVDAAVFGVRLLWYALCLVAGTLGVLCLILAALTLITVLAGLPWLMPPAPPGPPPVVLPRGPRA
jgi:hypothetical protein